MTDFSMLHRLIVYNRLLMTMHFDARLVKGGQVMIPSKTAKFMDDMNRQARNLGRNKNLRHRRCAETYSL